MLTQPRTCRARRPYVTDGMQQHQPIIVYQLIDLCEKLGVMVYPDMLEHPDGNDPVETVADFTIVPQLEAHTIGKAKPACLLAGQSMLLLRQGHAGDIDVLKCSKVQRQITPAAPNIEDLLPGSEMELGRN